MQPLIRVQVAAWTTGQLLWPLDLSFCTCSHVSRLCLQTTKGPLPKSLRQILGYQAMIHVRWWPYKFFQVSCYSSCHVCWSILITQWLAGIDDHSVSDFFLWIYWSLDCCCQAHKYLSRCRAFIRLTGGNDRSTRLWKELRWKTCNFVLGQKTIKLVMFWNRKHQ